MNCSASQPAMPPMIMAAIQPISWSPMARLLRRGAAQPPASSKPITVAAAPGAARPSRRHPPRPPSLRCRPAFRRNRRRTPRPGQHRRRADIACRADWSCPCHARGRRIARAPCARTRHASWSPCSHRISSSSGFQTGPTGRSALRGCTVLLFTRPLRFDPTLRLALRERRARYLRN